MRVLHVCETMLGGVGTYLNEIIPSQIDAYGKENVLFVAPRQDLIQTPDVLPSCIRAFARPSRLAGLLPLKLALLKAIVVFRPDIIHAHATFAGFMARLMAPFFGIKVVYCPHGWAMDRDQSPLSRFLVTRAEKTLSFLTKRIIAVSEAERQRGIAAGISPSRIVTILNGLRKEPPPFAPVSWEDSRLKVLFVGRLDRQKGIDILLKAIEGKDNEWCVRIVGDQVVGGKRPPFENYPHVTCLGWLKGSGVNAQIAACDVVVMPSRWEGLPLVGLEAMRLGKPLFAAAVGGVPEMIEEGVTGRLFAAEKSAQLRALLEAARQEDLTAMGQKARALFLEKFTAERMQQEVMRVYASLHQSQ